MKGYLAVTSTGAKVDGQADDSSAWAIAVDKAADVGGGTIVMPSGTSRVPNGIKLKSGVTIEGMSDKGSILDCSEANIAIDASGTAANEVKSGGLRNLTVKTGHDSIGIYCRYTRFQWGCYNIQLIAPVKSNAVGIRGDGRAFHIGFDTINMHYFRRAIELLRDDSISLSSNRFHFRRARIYRSYGTAIYIDRSQDNCFVDVDILEGHLVEPAIKIIGSYNRLYGVRNNFVNLRVADCDSPGTDYAIELVGCWANQFVSSTVQGECTNKGFAKGSIKMTSAIMNHFNGLVIDGSGANQLDIDANSKYNRVVGNTMFDNTRLQQFPDNTIIDLRD